MPRQFLGKNASYHFYDLSYLFEYRRMILSAHFFMANPRPTSNIEIIKIIEKFSITEIAALVDLNIFDYHARISCL
jgi:hypothetical protein